MVQQQPPLRSFASRSEYFSVDSAGNAKHEFYEGTIVEIPGGTYAHSVITTDLYIVAARAIEEANLDVQLMNSDLRVRVSEDGPYFYPDMSAVFGQAEVDTDNCLVNPYILAEVLSETSAAFDRDQKFRAYRRITSLRHYLLIAQNEVRIEHFERLPGGIWALVGEHDDINGSVGFADLGVAVPLAAIYRRVAF